MRPVPNILCTLGVLASLAWFSFVTPDGANPNPDLSSDIGPLILLVVSAMPVVIAFLRSAPDIRDLIPRKRGHFVMASGLHSDTWLDLDAALANPAALRPHIDQLAKLLARQRPDVICGPLSGGARIADMLAEKLGVEACHAARRAPDDEFAILAQQRDMLAGRRIAIVDDAIQAGSAVRGALADARACGATPVALAALVVLGPHAEQLAQQHEIPLIRLARLKAGLWNPSACPSCSAGVPLEHRS